MPKIAKKPEELDKYGNPKETDPFVRLFDYLFMDSPLWAKHCAFVTIMTIAIWVVITASIPGGF